MKKRYLILLSTSILMTIAVVNVIGVGLKKDLISNSNQEDYSLTFNTANGIKSEISEETNFQINTNNGNIINFVGNNLASYKNGFATFNSNSYFKNIDQITSIKSLYVEYSGDLYFHSSYDGIKYGEYVAINDSYEYQFSSDFYYFELSSNSGAIINNFVITYSCISNTEIDNLPKETTYNLVEEDLSDYSGTYIIGYINGNSVYSFNGDGAKGNYTTYNSYNNGVITKFTPAAEYLIEPYNSGYSIKILGGSNDGKYISGTSVVIRLFLVIHLL